MQILVLLTLVVIFMFEQHKSSLSSVFISSMNIILPFSCKYVTSLMICIANFHKICTNYQETLKVIPKKCYSLKIYMLFTLKIITNWVVFCMFSGMF